MDTPPRFCWDEMADHSSELRDRPSRDLLLEIEMLRAENARLRGLLGPRASAAIPPSADRAPGVPPGGLTLFEDEAAGLPQVDAKSSAGRIEVHDYVDAKVPVLARMLTKRLAAYATLGFDVGGVAARRR